MIERYREPEMADIWSETRRIEIWLQIEWLVCEELFRLQLIPPADFRELKRSWRDMIRRGHPKRNRMLQLEQSLKHELLSFTSAVSEQLGPAGRYLHYGLTSSDVLDTGFGLSLLLAGKEILNEWDKMIHELESLAMRTRDWPCLARSHGVAAEPTLFGYKVLGWHAEARRQRLRLQSVISDVAVGKLSGPVGTYPVLSPESEKRVLSALGLGEEPVSTQVVSRDRHAQFFVTLAQCFGLIERVALEIRHLSRTEVAEVREGFSAGQKGSSAMPHKRNPISSENLCGVARLLRGYALSALENSALWHERDMSHSSVERIIGPDSTCLFHYGTRRLTRLLRDLQLDSNRMLKNLKDAGPSVYSSEILLRMVSQGFSRESAYHLIQQASFAVQERGENSGLALAEEISLRARKLGGKVLSASVIQTWMDVGQIRTRLKGQFSSQLMAGNLKSQKIKATNGSRKGRNSR